MILAENIRSKLPLSRLAASDKVRWLWKFTICNSILLNAFLAVTALLLLNKGLLLRSSVSSALSAAGLYFFRGRQGTDSWGPMLQALHSFFSGLPIYETTFFVKNVKFQYPLPSLLPFYVLIESGVGNDTILRICNILCWCSVLITIAVSIRIFLGCQRLRSSNLTQKDLLSLGISAAVSGLFFYPLLKAYSQGQLQCFIDVLFALALCCWIGKKEAVSGLLIGFICLMKPQYCLILLWFVFRKKFSALVPAAAVILTGLIFAGVVFGWRDQFAYFGVLSYMGKHGEVFFENQSVNGFLHRLLMQGNSLKWEPNTFAPYSPFVYVASLISSLSFLAAALFYPKLKKNQESSRDFALIGLVATMASPIVWEHHYGIVLPIAAYLAGSLTRPKDLGWLGAAFVLIGTSWTPFNIFATLPGLNVLQSLPFLGSIVLFLLFFLSKLPEPQCSPATAARTRKQFTPVVDWTKTDTAEPVQHV